MSNTVKAIKNFCLSLVIILAFIIASGLAVSAQSDSKTPAPKSANYIETVAKVLSIDPIKGDVSVRLEFMPHGNLMKEDGTYGTPP